MYCRQSSAMVRMASTSMVSGRELKKVLYSVVSMVSREEKEKEHVFIQYSLVCWTHPSPVTLSSGYIPHCPSPGFP